MSRLALTHLPGTVHRELASPGPARDLHAVTLSEHGVTPMVAAFLRLLHDVAEDITGSWPAGG